MMSQANVEIVREVMSLVEDARNGDLSHLEEQTRRLRDLVTDDAEIDMSTRVFLAATPPTSCSLRTKRRHTYRPRTRLLQGAFCQRRLRAPAQNDKEQYEGARSRGQAVLANLESISLGPGRSVSPMQQWTSSCRFASGGGARCLAMIDACRIRIRLLLLTGGRSNPERSGRTPSRVSAPWSSLCRGRTPRAALSPN